VKESPIVIIGVAALLIMFGGLAYAVTSNMNNADVTIYINSTHITRTVEVFIYVDGRQVSHIEEVKPGAQWYYNHRETFPIWKDSTIIEIKAISQGGGLGSQTDTSILIMQKDKSYRVNLYV